MLARDAPVPDVGLGQQRHGVVELHADLLDRMRQDVVARRSGDRDVEVGVVTHVVGLGRGGGHALDRLAHGFEIGGLARFRGDPHHDRLDEAAVLSEAGAVESRRDADGRGEHGVSGAERARQGEAVPASEAPCP